MNKKKDALFTTHPAIIAVWAALIAVSALLPALPVLGTGATLNISASLIPLAGIFFGPLGGAVAAGIGAFIGQLIAPHTVLFGPFQFIIPVASAFMAGLAMRGKWQYPFITIIVLGSIWYAFPLGRAAWATPLLYLIGLVSVLIGWIFGKDLLNSSKRGKIFLGVFLSAMAGIVVDQALGNLWAMIMFALPPAIWFTVLAIAPIERIGFGIGAAIVGTPLLIGLPKISIMVGPALFEEIDYEEDFDDEDKAALSEI